MQERLLKPKYNYCLDTSVLIDLNQYYPSNVSTFKPLWVNLENLIKNNWAHAPREVFKELQSLDDSLLEWAKQNKNMFRQLDDLQVTKLKEILKQFPNLCDPKKEYAHADPFIVAHALCEGCTVVTNEKPSAPNARIIQIPNVCLSYKIRHISLLELFHEQNW